MGLWVDGGDGGKVGDGTENGVGVGLEKRWGRGWG
jgi:hypothetical protein